MITFEELENRLLPKEANEGDTLKWDGTRWIAWQNKFFISSIGKSVLIAIDSLNPKFSIVQTLKLFINQRDLKLSLSQSTNIFIQKLIQTFHITKIFKIDVLVKKIELSLSSSKKISIYVLVPAYKIEPINLKITLTNPYRIESIGKINVIQT